MRAVVWIVLGLYLGIGAVWTVLNLGEFPHYGDTLGYLHLAKELKVDAYRGIVYPALLALAGKGCAGADLPERLRWEHDNADLPCAVPPGFVCVQIFQIFVGIFCLAYFVDVMFGRRERLSPDGGPRIGRLRWGLLAVLFFDPLISHYNLALMTDGLGLALSLLFCAALTDFLRKRTAPWMAGALLFIAFVLVAGLRVEKKWIMLGTIVAAPVLWAFCQRRTRVKRAANLLPRAALALGLGCVGLLAVNAGHRIFYKESERWPARETIVHLRFIFPHLTAVYDELPERTRALISPEDAKYYDSHLNNARRLINRITAGDGALRHELTKDLANVVVSSRGYVIALDIARDTVENIAATFSFCVRLVTWRANGEAYRRLFYSDGTVWIYERFVLHHPRWSHLYLYVSGLLLVLATGIALLMLYRRLRGGPWRKELEGVAEWLPAAVFCILNAFAFAATQDLVQIRYALISHALFLCMIHSALIRWLLSPAGPARE